MSYEQPAFLHRKARSRLCPRTPVRNDRDRPLQAPSFYGRHIDFLTPGFWQFISASKPCSPCAPDPPSMETRPLADKDEPELWPEHCAFYFCSSFSPDPSEPIPARSFFNSPQCLPCVWRGSERCGGGKCFSPPTFRASQPDPPSPLVRLAS
jgi:hypothetical protein